MYTNIQNKTNQNTTNNTLTSNTDDILSSLDQVYLGLNYKGYPYHQLQLPYTNMDTAKMKTHDKVGLELSLPTICNYIQKCLGPYHDKDIYRRCLASDLQSFGLNISQNHVLAIQYKKEWVGYKRIDILVTTPYDNERHIFDIKAVNKLTHDHLKQLEHNLHRFNIDTGFLINFPCNTVFSGIPEHKIGETKQSIFKHSTVSGNIQLYEHTKHVSQHKVDIEIIKVYRKHVPEGPESFTSSF